MKAKVTVDYEEYKNLVDFKEEVQKGALVTWDSYTEQKGSGFSTTSFHTYTYCQDKEALSRVELKRANEDLISKNEWLKETVKSKYKDGRFDEAKQIISKNFFQLIKWWLK